MENNCKFWRALADLCKEHGINQAFLCAANPTVPDKLFTQGLNMSVTEVIQWLEQSTIPALKEIENNPPSGKLIYKN